MPNLKQSLSSPDMPTFHPGLVVKSPRLDGERAVAYSVGWDAQIKTLSKHERLLIEIAGFHTPHIQFGSTSYNAPFLVQGVCPKKSVVITYNRTEGVVNYRNHRLQPGELLVMTRDEEMDLVISQRNTTFTIAIDEDFFQESFFAYYGVAFGEASRRKTLLLNPKEELAFLRFIQSWLHYFVEYEATKKHMLDYAKIETQIIHALFSFIIVDDASLRKENAILKRAREMLHGSLDHDLKLTDTARELGVSQRTLQYTFRHNLGMTPKMYLQLLRLHKVREELKAANPVTTKVSDVALKYAFFHLGHFASEYRKLFGESPVETLRH